MTITQDGTSCSISLSLLNLSQIPEFFWTLLGIAIIILAIGQLRKEQ